MNKKRVIGIILTCLGIAMLFFSSYIRSEVLEGKQQISHAQKSVDSGKGLFKGPSKAVGEGIFSGAQKKIDKGRDDVRFYSALAQWLKVGGIIFIVGGVILIIFGRSSAAKS